MFSLFIVLVSFSISLACEDKVSEPTKKMMNDESCMARPTPVNMNPVELKCYPFMISLNKFAVS